MGLKFIVIGLNIFNQSLKNLGHQVLHAHHRPDADLDLRHPATSARILAHAESLGFKPDAVLYVDDGNLPLVIDPEKFPCASLYYSIDSYCNPWHFSYAHGFDQTLVAQKDFLPIFLENGHKALWLPLFAPLECEQSAGERDIPVAFVGTLGHKNNPERLPFLQNFRKAHPLLIISGDYRQIFSRSRIALNQTAFGELNFRCFEAMSCGAALLMEKCENGLTEIFEEGVNILPAYPKGNARKAAEIASAWLKNPAKLAELAENGRRLVLKSHSASARAAAICEIVLNLIKTDAPKERLENLETRTILTRSAYGMLAAELTDPKWQTYRKFYEQLAG